MLIFISISYPVIADPPLLDGADQERLTLGGEPAIAARPVGGPGGLLVDWLGGGDVVCPGGGVVVCPGGGVDVGNGVAEASFEGGE